MTPSLSYGQSCPCGTGTVTGVMDGRVHAKTVSVSSGFGVTVSYEFQHSHTFAEVATMLRKAKWREVDRKHWPHDCVRCGGPAFVGFNQVDCADRCVP